MTMILRITRAVGTVTILALAGCSSFNGLLSGEKLDYKSASKPTAGSLEIPPDLSSLPRDDRYAVPERGATTLSGYNLTRTATAAAPSTLLPTVPQARLERGGSERWLVVTMKPEQVWPILKDFWQDMGFLIKTESQDTGIMETDWAENRAKIPQDFLRDTLGKVLDGMYSSGERDKFRTRIERAADGNTEIYISHRGMIEVFTNAQKDTTAWQPRAADPGLEAEFLRRLLLRFGVETERARAVVASTPETAHAKLVTAPAGGSYVEVDEGFDRAWRRVGLALDRVGFTVEDRDRSRGVFFVRYVDPDADAKTGGKEGFFGRLFKGSDDKNKSALQYRITVAGPDNSSRVTVQNKDGAPETSDVGTRILTLLQEQLK